MAERQTMAEAEGSDAAMGGSLSIETLHRDGAPGLEAHPQPCPTRPVTLPSLASLAFLVASLPVHFPHYFFDMLSYRRVYATTRHQHYCAHTAGLMKTLLRSEYASMHKACFVCGCSLCYGNLPAHPARNYTGASLGDEGLGQGARAHHLHLDRPALLAGLAQALGGLPQPRDPRLCAWPDGWLHLRLCGRHRGARHKRACHRGQQAAQR